MKHRKKAKRAHLESIIPQIDPLVALKRSNLKMLMAAIRGSKMPDTVFLCASLVVPNDGLISMAISVRDLRLLVEAVGNPEIAAWPLP